MSSKRGNPPLQGCTLAWCHGTVAANSLRRDGKRVALPLQQGWAAVSVSPPNSLSHLPIDVHLYIRGGVWIEQFSSKLVGEVGGNRHLSSIYVTGLLREQGEAEYRAKLEAKGWTLPDGFQCGEWVLYQRQGDRIIIKLSYAKMAALEGVTVFLEATLTDGDIWWALPVLVDTGDEYVFDKLVPTGIYSPAIEDQEIAIGVANRGPENLAIMPCIDGRNLLKAPYFLWAGDSRKRNWDQGGQSFVTFQGLQTDITTNKRGKASLTFKSLRFQKTPIVESQVMIPDRDQGSLKVKVFKTRRTVWKSDPDRMLEQMEQMRKEVFAASAAKGVGPLRLRETSKDLHHFDLHAVSSGEEVKQTMSSLDISSEIHQFMGEIVINYRSLGWFREAATVKHRLQEAMATSPTMPVPVTPNQLQKLQPVGNYPDSISPIQLQESNSVSRSQQSQAVSGTDISVSLEPERQRLARLKAKSSDSEGRSPSPSPRSHKGLPPTPRQETSLSGPLSSSHSSDSLTSPALASRKSRDVSPSSRAVQSEPKLIRGRSFHSTRSSSSPREKSPPQKSPLLADKSLRMRDKSPVPSRTQVRDKSPGLTPVRARDKSPSVVNRLRETSPATRTTTGKSPKEREGVSLVSDKTGSNNKTKTKVKAKETRSPGKQIEVDGTTVWVMPRIQGRAEALQKDEIVVKATLRNIANLRRQVKVDLSPLLDEWSTAELVVIAGDVVLPPELLLEDLPTGTGSASNPIILEAPDKMKAI